MINISVIDDEPIFVEILVNEIYKYCSLLNIHANIDKFYNAYDLMENFKKYHLIFLDINMPFVDGLAIAKIINDSKKESEIPFFVFITSHDELVFDALKFFPYSFIRKTDITSTTCISELLIRVSNLIEKNGKTITIRTNRQDVVLRVSDIIYIEKYKNYSYIKTKLERYPVKSSLLSYEKLLSDYGFIRCHDGYIVSINNIFKISDKFILLTNNENIPMSRNKSKAVKEAFVKRSIFYNGQ